MSRRSPCLLKLNRVNRTLIQFLAAVMFGSRSELHQFPKKSKSAYLQISQAPDSIPAARPVFGGYQYATTLIAVPEVKSQPNKRIPARSRALRVCKVTSRLVG